MKAIAISPKSKTETNSGEPELRRFEARVQPFAMCTGSAPAPISSKAWARLEKDALKQKGVRQSYGIFIRGPYNLDPTICIIRISIGGSWGCLPKTSQRLYNQ